MKISPEQQERVLTAFHNAVAAKAAEWSATSEIESILGVDFDGSALIEDYALVYDPKRNELGDRETLLQAIEECLQGA